MSLRKQASGQAAPMHGCRWLAPPTLVKLTAAGEECAGARKRLLSKGPMLWAVSVCLRAPLLSSEAS